MLVLRSILLFIFFLVAIPYAAQAQLPGTWERIYICDTCPRPYLVLADEDAVLAMTGGNSYYNTFTSLDTGTSWAQARMYTRFVPLEPSNFNVTNFEAPNPTDDRRGRRPTCAMFCFEQIFASFNAGANWDHTLDFPIGENAATYKMFDAARGFLITKKWAWDTLTFMGHDISDTGFTYSFPTFYHKVPCRHPLQYSALSDGIIWDRQSLNLFTIIDSQTTQFRSTNGGTSWIGVPFPRALGALRPIAKGFKTGRMIGIRRNGSNDLMVTNTYGANWDTIGPKTNRAMYVHEPASDRLWLLTARTSVRPEVNLFDLRRTAQVDTLYFSSDQGKTWQQDLTFVGDTISSMAWADRDLGYVLGHRDGRTYVARFVPNRLNVAVTKSTDLQITASPNPFMGSVSLRSNRSGEARIDVKDVLGRQLLSSSAQFVIGEPMTLQLPTASHETYILTVRYNDGEQATIKLVSHE